MATLVKTCAADDATAIFVMKLDGSELRRIAQVLGFRKHGSPRWSHDGKRLLFDASQGPNNAWKVYAINFDGTGLTEIGEHGLADWSPDDKQIACYSYGVNQKTGVWIQNVDGKGREFLAFGAAPRWSPDGGRIAMTNANSVMILNLLDGEQRNLVDESFGDMAGGFDWSPDGKRIAFVTRRNNKNELWIADVDGKNKTLRLTGSLNGHLCWSPDGQRLAIAQNHLIQLLAVEGKRAAEPIPGQAVNNLMPAWSPDGQWIAFSSDRKTPELSTRTNAPRKFRLEEVKRHAKGSIVYSFGFTPDGRRLVMGGDPVSEGVHVWDMATDKTKSLGGQGIVIAMLADGRRFATSWLESAIHIVDIDSGDVTRELQHGDTVRTIAVNKDGSRLVSGGLDKLLHVWDLARGERVTTFDKHQEWITRAVFSADGKEVISAGHDNKLRIWNAANAAQRLEIEHPEPIWALAVSPDGRHILTGTGGTLVGNPRVLEMNQGSDNVLRLWETATGKLVREMKGHTHAAYTVDFSPDGRLAVSGSWDTTIRLWDLQTGEELSRIEGGQGGVMKVLFSPDGQQVFAGGGVSRLAGSRINEFPDEQIRIYRLVQER
jgi:WD40 repeat protein